MEKGSLMVYWGSNKKRLNNLKELFSDFLSNEIVLDTKILSEPITLHFLNRIKHEKLVIILQRDELPPWSIKSGIFERMILTVEKNKYNSEHLSLCDPHGIIAPKKWTFMEFKNDLWKELRIPILYMNVNEYKNMMRMEEKDPACKDMFAGIDGPSLFHLNGEEVRWEISEYLKHKIDESLIILIYDKEHKFDDFIEKAKMAKIEHNLEERFLNVPFYKYLIKLGKCNLYTYKDA